LNRQAADDNVVIAASGFKNRNLIILQVPLEAKAEIPI
jgi:hypothetical protein